MPVKRGSERTSQNDFPQLTAKTRPSHGNPQSPHPSGTRSRLRPLSRQNTLQRTNHPQAHHLAPTENPATGCNRWRSGRRRASVGYRSPSTFQFQPPHSTRPTMNPPSTSAKPHSIPQQP
ncbi:hypothetical protein RB8739 [Rhodopirellula baltica SH 1]|uniref:Uncharacterized protein n=1 Tax=Rhodopirellula baltica (strain DSM 10527 / NCIMB 13988 / SH1) TaxID=243090 RepID=Q7UMM3_RHOBA|nr:hypothetical protein RB8739 [Rhodopirellula baltica SH 1]